MARRHPAPALAIALLGVALPACALAQAGDYRLEGRELPHGHDYTVALHITRSEAGWQVERTQRFASGKESEQPGRTWRSTAVVRQGSVLRVSFQEAKQGLSGALEGLEGDDARATARYLLGPGSKVREWFTPADGRAGLAQGGPMVKTLKLVREAKLATLFAGSDLELDEYEASGVILVEGELYVVFDNRSHVGVVPLDLSPDRSRLIKTRGKGKSDFEGISYDPVAKKFVVVVEAKRHDGERRGRVWELDRNLVRQNREWLDDYDLPSANKGFEGLTFVRREGREFLLALLEGNNGESGKEAFERGKGEMAVFRRKAGTDNWRHKDKLKLPKSAFFFDYSGVDVQGDRMVVVSQTSSMIWVGKLDASSWSIVGEGTVYRFPRLGSRPLYATVEGVTWISERRIAVVSDATDDAVGSAKAESIHIFDLP